MSKLSHFDERNGVYPCPTPWGKWWQTVNEVFIEINVPEGTCGADCRIKIESKFIECSVKDKVILSGPLFKYVHPESSIWTLEEKKTINILLDKSERFYDDKNAWLSLLEKEYRANRLTELEMKEQMDLEKLQLDDPHTFNNPFYVLDYINSELEKLPDDVMDQGETDPEFDHHLPIISNVLN